jgi:HPt (histidine-containing phosphotransfer) domain-containing protein
MVDRWTKRIEDCRLLEQRGNPDLSGKIEDRENENDNPEQPSTVNRQSKDDAPMNFEKVLDDFEGDKELLTEAMNLFLESVRNQIGALRQAISDNDADLVRREAHSIKGGAANLTADELSRVAFELETIGKSGTLGTSTVILERLEKEFYRLDAFAKNR